MQLSKKSNRFLHILNRNNILVIFLVCAPTLLFLCTVIVVTIFLSGNTQTATKETHTVEVAAIPVNNNYFESGFVTPASCGVIVDKGGVTADYGHTEWGGACSPPPAAVYGSCGAAARYYTYNETAYSGAFCASGSVSPASPAFPDIGTVEYWDCNGSNGGTNASCYAIRDFTTPSPSSGSLCPSPSALEHNAEYHYGVGGPITTASGKIGDALELNGTSDFVSISSTTAFDDLSKITIAGWIYPRSTGENGLGGIIGKRGSTTFKGWELLYGEGFFGSPGLVFEGDFSSWNLVAVTTPDAFPLNTWSYVVVTWDGSESVSTRAPGGVHIYRNGQEVFYDLKASGLGSRVSDANNDLVLGNVNPFLDRTWDGYFDEMRVYNRVLSPSEIQTLYTSVDPAVVPSGLVGYWPFNCTTACFNGVDDDGDSFIDAADPGCWLDISDSSTYDPGDDDETNSALQCSDGIDNDGDGKIDALDPGCWSTVGDPSSYDPNDNDETDPPPPQCSDGIDNDGDGQIDYPSDPGCTDSNDDDETDPLSPQCIPSLEHNPQYLNYDSGVTTVPGVLGQALSMDDNIANQVSITDDPSFEPPKNLTVSAWIFSDGHTGIEQYFEIIGKRQSDGYALEYSEYGWGGCPAKNFCMVIRSGGAYRTASVFANPADFNKWTHLVGTYDGNTIKLYVDGNLASSYPYVGSISYVGTTNVCLGSDADGPVCDGASDTIYEGLLDDVRIYNRTLSPSEVQDLYDLTDNPSLQTNLVGYWTFDCLLPDLTSDSLALQSGTLKQGQSLTFTASVRNKGGDTGIGFSDEFSYQWGGTSGAWNTWSGSTIAKAALAAGASSPDISPAFALTQSGQLYIQHCIDSAMEITESDESAADNCRVLGPLDIVSNQPSGNISANPTSVYPGDTSDVTWNSSNTTDCAVSVNPDNGDSGSGTSGSLTTSALTSTTTPYAYTLSCDGNVLDSVNISVISIQPQLSTDKTHARFNEPVRLIWNTDNGDETGCTITGGSLGSTLNPLTSASGNIDVGDAETGIQEFIMQGTATYTLTCPGGSDSVTVHLIPGIWES